MEEKGKKILKVCGVIFIIEGIIGIIGYGILTLVLSFGLFVQYVEGGLEVVGVALLYTIAAIVALVAGILGIKYSKGKADAGKCLIWGVINLIMTFAGGMWSLADEGITIVHVLYTCLGFIIPSLYIAGAYINKE